MDYGFPSGLSLIHQVASALGDTAFLKRPLLELGYSEKELLEFRSRLVGARLTSIDVFLEDNSDRFQQIGKACIAGTILRRENDALGRLRGDRGTGFGDNWLQYVWNVMKASTGRDTFSDNAVSFVTFNYDRLVEFYFADVLAAAFGLQSQDAAQLRDDTFRVVHLHGAVGAAAEFGQDPSDLTGDALGELASTIRIVHDPMLDGDPLFRSASEAFANANQVCMLGFGYHPDNIRRLNISPTEPATLLGTAFEMMDEERETVIRDFGRGLTLGRPNEKCTQFVRRRVALR